MTTKVLSDKIAELVALGAAIAATCQPCLHFHLRAVREAGASDDEIREALTIGRTVRQTPARLIDEAANRGTGTAFVPASPSPGGNGDVAATSPTPAAAPSGGCGNGDVAPVAAPTSTTGTTSAGGCGSSAKTAAGVGASRATRSCCG